MTPQLQKTESVKHAMLGKRTSSEFTFRPIPPSQKKATVLEMETPPSKRVKPTSATVMNLGLEQVSAKIR